MQVVLVMFRADGERRSFSLPRDVTVIGRREDCDLRIPLGDVSRKHCRLIKEGDTIRIEDLGSSNGTYHNGQRVQESVIGAGDTVQIGPVVFVCQVDGHPSEDELQPFDAAAAAAVASMAGGEAVDAGELEEVASAEDLEPVDTDEQTQELLPTGGLEDLSDEQEQTLAGSGAANFDPMEVLQSSDDEDDIVDFNIADESAESDDSVHINFDPSGDDRSTDRA